MSVGEIQAFLESVPDALLQPKNLGAGQGVSVAIVDSGIEATHPDLAARVVRSVEVHSDARGKWSVVEAPPKDDNGHGTACADIVGRLAPECKLWSVRALGPSCRGTSGGLLAAFRWCIDNGADVINLSLGTRELSMAEPLRRLVAKAYRKGIMVVVATSNVPGVQSYPAVFTSLVCVDAAYLENQEHFFFRFGDMSELVAPGVYVDAAWPGGGRKLVTGTSFACPHISGHIARIVSANPGIKPFHIKTVLFAMGKRYHEQALEQETEAT